jgi:hypothetical protein
MAINKRIIRSNDEAAAGASFNTVLYTGNGSTQSITGVGFEPDLVWAKSRSASGYWHVIADKVRGVNNTLASNETAAERTGGRITSFDSDGFGVNVTPDVSSNASGVDYVAWCWKAGGAAVSANSIEATNATRSANPEAGFSIIKFDSSSSTASPPPMNYIEHGLNSAPEMVIYKRLESSQNWIVQHDGITTNGALNLNLTDAQSGPFTYDFFDNTATNIGVRSNYAIGRDANYIAYCFAEVAGFSKFGSYTGVSGGVTIDVGFEPAFVMVKCYDNAEPWVIVDNKRTSPAALFPSGSDAEYTSANFSFTFTSTGFSFPDQAIADASLNQGGYNYIYMAFANQF